MRSMNYVLFFWVGDELPSGWVENARWRKLDFPSSTIVVDFCHMFWCFEELFNIFVRVLYKLYE